MNTMRKKAHAQRSSNQISSDSIQCKVEIKKKKCNHNICKAMNFPRICQKLKTKRNKKKKRRSEKIDRVRDSGQRFATNETKLDKD